MIYSLLYLLLLLVWHAPLAVRSAYCIIKNNIQNILYSWGWSHRKSRCGEELGTHLPVGFCCVHYMLYGTFLSDTVRDDLLWSIIMLSWCSVNIVACRTWRGVGRDHNSVARQRSLCLSLGNYSKRSSVCWVDLLSSQTGSRALNTVLSQHYWFCA